MLVIRLPQCLLYGKLKIHSWRAPAQANMHTVMASGASVFSAVLWLGTTLMKLQQYRTELSKFLIPMFTLVIVVQGIHVIEHIIQLVQVYKLGIPDDKALGLLGYVFVLQGTEEWLHLVFNASYFLPLVVLAFLLQARSPSVIPRWALLLFTIGGAVLEGWHVVEHIVIMSHVIANNGCPCPGILDPILGISDTILHFFYNVATYLAILPAFWYVMHDWIRSRSGAHAIKVA
jgi:hypothetical protein